MIAYVKGRFTKKAPTDVIVDINGLGYHLHVSLNTYTKIEKLDEGLLYTYMHLVVGQGGTIFALYGFAEEAEKEMFEYLISVSGVGANTARLALSAATAEEVAAAIRSENLMFFKKIKGIGEKTAKVIIATLRDKVAKAGIGFGDGLSDSGVGAGANNNAREEALIALTTLGFQKIAVQKALNQIIKQYPELTEVESYVKLALKQLS